MQVPTLDCTGECRGCNFSNCTQRRDTTITTPPGITITKMGQIGKKFKCRKCGTEWLADSRHYKNKQVHMNEYKTVCPCPVCKEEAEE